MTTKTSDKPGEQPDPARTDNPASQATPDTAASPAPPAPDDPDPAPDPLPAATVQPAQYSENKGMRVGQYAPEARYGVISPDGSVKPTARQGKAEPKPGEYGTIVVQAGDVVTHAVRATLGITD